MTAGWAGLLGFAGGFAATIAAQQPEPGEDLVARMAAACQAQCVAGARDLAQQALAGMDVRDRGLEVVMAYQAAETARLVEGCAFWSRDRLVAAERAPKAAE